MMNGIPSIDENPWAEGPAIEPRPTDLGPLLPPLPAKPKAKPKAGRVKAKMKGLLGRLKKSGPKADEDEPPATKRRGDRNVIVVPSSPLTPPPPCSSVSAPPSSPLSPPPLFGFGTGTPHEFRFEDKGNSDKGKGRAIASPSPKVIKRKPVPVPEDLVSLSRKRTFDEIDEDGPGAPGPSRAGPSDDDLPAWSRPGPSRPMKGRVLDFGGSSTASSLSSEEVAVDVEKEIVPAVGLQKALATIDEEEENDSPVSAPETDVVVVKSPGPAEKVLAPVQRTGFPATSYSPGGLRNADLKGVNGHPARAVRRARLELDAEPPVGIHPNFRDFHKALVTWLDAREHVFLRASMETLEENFAIEKALGAKAIDLWLACLDIIWWGTEIVWPAKAEKEALPGDIPVGIEGVEFDIVGFIGALLEFYDNDNTRTRSHILERTPDLFSQMGKSGAVVRLIGSGPWSPRLLDSSKSGPVDPKVCRPSNPNNSKGIVKG
jgi:hypothetical protein